MKGNALIVAVSSLVAMLGLSKRKHRTDRASLGDVRAEPSATMP